MQDAPIDSRFPIFNTNVAACMAALRIPIKTTDPVYVVEDGEPLFTTDGTRKLAPRRTVTYFFEQESAPSNDGYAIEQASHVEWAWRHREEFEKENPTHPLVYMRRAIDKLEWLIKVRHGHINPVKSDVPGYKACVENIVLAACIMGLGHKLHRFLTNNEFVFDIPVEEFERIQEEFSCFRHGKDPICYMRKALEARKELIALVKRAPILLRYQAGEKEGLIPKGISAKKLNQFFELLYE